MLNGDGNENISLLVLWRKSVLYVLNKNLAAYVPVRFFFFHFRSFSPYWPLAVLVTFSHRRNKIFIVLSSQFVSFVFSFVCLLFISGSSSFLRYPRQRKARAPL